MPEPIKDPANQTGHRTLAEKQARRAASEGLQRAHVSLRAPAWLSEEARKIWKTTCRHARGLELLDNLDSQLLAVYCDALARYQQTLTNLVMVDDDGQEVAREELVKSAQAWARLIASYADKLGLSPAGRARLAKRKADETLDTFGEAFDG